MSTPAAAPPGTAESPSTFSLCSYDEVPNRTAKALELKGVGKGGAIETRPLVIVRWDDKVYGYINHCPHTPTQLDARIPGQFFNEEHSYLMCDKHGALFEVDTGECFDGPCQGQALSKLSIEVIGGEICLTGIQLVDAAED